MTGMKRNMRAMSYRKGSQYENDTIYGEPVRFMGSVTPAGGYVGREMFGTLADYDYTVITHDKALPIVEDDLIVFDGENHVIRRIAKNLNVTAIAVKRRLIDES